MSVPRRWSGGRSSPASLQRRLPFTDEDAADEDASQLSSHSSSRPLPLAIPRQRPASSSQNLSSSIGHRIPTRSFAHNASGSVEPIHYSSQGVREQTQQLATWGLEQSGSLPRGPSISAPTQTSSDGETSSRRRTSLRSEPEQGEGRELPDSALPEVIPEVSEPMSPEGEGGTPDPSRTTAATSSSAAQALSSSKSRDKYGRMGTIDVPEIAVEDADERTALLPKAAIPTTRFKRRRYKDPGLVESQEASIGKGTLHGARTQTTAFWRTLSHPKAWSPKAVGQGVITSVKSVGFALPAVFLGWLLNVLDALSYGTILFPLGEAIFEDTGPDGIAIFFVSTVISQVVYSCRSKFKGGVGSEMIEVVPFFHKMAYLIMAQMGATASTESITSTVYISYILSSVLTGIIFLLLGVFKLGNLVSFFPRSILTGCIGGVGVFLFLTGIEVSAGINGNLEFNMATLEKLLKLDTLPLWTIPLVLAIMLFVVRLFSERPWIVPVYFISIMVIFYIVVAATPHLNLEDLRGSGWVFEQPRSGVAFYHFYSFYNLKIVDWSAIAKCIPTMFALSFFGIIHVPINVPALALAVQEDDISTNQELINHGLSNTISGFAGSIQNYLVYANSQMFIRNGGNSRLAGFLLALVTLATWVAGPEAIGFIPKMIVGTLIYLLGIDLVKEALWDTFGRIHKLEYLMILVIVLVMGFHDFVVGIVVGIILSSLIFVVQTSRVSAIRAIYSGSVAESTVRRHPVHRRFLHEVGTQLRVFKLAGYLFFGTIVDVEKQVRRLIDEDEFSRQPIRFLVIDFLHVTGLDFSAAEAFARLRRILHNKNVSMILSGISMSGEIGRSLAMVGLFNTDEADESDVPPRVFEDLNKALEACENDQLIAFKMRSDAISTQLGQPSVALPVSGVPGSPSPSAASLDASFASPRRTHLQQAAATTLEENDTLPPPRWTGLKQPLLLMLQTFRNYSDKDIDFWYQAVPYFAPQPLAHGTVLFSAGDRATGFYLLEEGIITCTYNLDQGSYQESIVAGTTCGELPFFAGVERSATAHVERSGMAWVLKRDEWERLGREWSEGERELLRVGLRLTSERTGAITSYVLVNAS